MVFNKPSHPMITHRQSGQLGGRLRYIHHINKENIYELYYINRNSYPSPQGLEDFAHTLVFKQNALSSFPF